MNNLSVFGLLIWQYLTLLTYFQVANKHVAQEPKNHTQLEKKAVDLIIEKGKVTEVDPDSVEDVKEAAEKASEE